MNLLTAQQLSKSYGPRTLFANIDLAMNEGEKIGVIGPNGCGKSTMLQILAGRIDADSGIVTMKKGATALYVDQDPTFPEGTTPTEAVAQIMGPLRETIAQWEAITEQIAAGSGDMTRLLEEQATLGDTIERLGGWNWSHRVETYLERLGIRPDDRERPLHTLSGGQRRRVALARALLAAPDLLMLDEPTNHLDADTLEWLEQTLAAYSGAMLLITHDRYFLDRVVTRIVEFDDQGLYSCPGAYSIFIERKLERERMRSKAESRRLKILSREMEWLSRGPKARTTKSKSRIDRAHELMDAAPEADNTRLNLNFNADNRLGGIILEVNGLAKSYDDLEVFKGLHLAVQRQDKIGIIGPNGCGKSTFLRVLLGQERPDAGKIRWGNKTRPGYLSQTRDELDPKDTVLDALSPNEMVRVGKRSVHKRGYLQEFLFDDGAQRKKVGALSGGERCRLLLAKLMLENANILILDEPTNDLDIVSLQLLEDALRSFQGCILMVTHDRYFLNKVCNVIAAFEDDHIERYDGDYDFYRARRDAKANEERKAAAAVRKEAERARDAERKAAKPRKLTWAEKNELEGMETTILEAEERKEALEAKLADPALYRDHPTKVPGLNADLQTLTTEIEALYARWEALEALKP